MQVQTEDTCLVCGKKNSNGLKIDFVLDADNHKAFAKATIGKMFNGYVGIVHGGIVCALLDEVGFHACKTVGVVTVTMNLNTKFKRPVPIDKELYIEGEVTEKRSRSIVASSKIMLDGQVLATASGEYFIKQKFNS